MVFLVLNRYCSNNTWDFRNTCDVSEEELDASEEEQDEVPAAPSRPGLRNRTKLGGCGDTNLSRSAAAKTQRKRAAPAAEEEKDDSQQAQSGAVILQSLNLSNEVAGVPTSDKLIQIAGELVGATERTKSFEYKRLVIKRLKEMNKV